MVAGAEMPVEKVKQKLDEINSESGNIDTLNMPTRCESCQIFLRDFEARALEIPLKLVSSFRSSFASCF